MAEKAGLEATTVAIDEERPAAVTPCDACTAETPDAELTVAWKVMIAVRRAVATDDTSLPVANLQIAVRSGSIP